MGDLKERFDESIASQQGRDVRWLKLEELVAELHEEGHDFNVQQGRVVQGQLERSGHTNVGLDFTEHLSLGILGDTHLGSRFEQLSALKDFYRQCDDHNDGKGVHAFIHGGDFVQGTPKMHRGMEHEVHLLSAEGQVGYSAEVYPRSRHGTITYAISGNHDDSWLNESGSNVIRQIGRIRDDIKYIGRDAQYLSLQAPDGERELRIYTVHPAGGASYAKSYKPQKITEAIPIREGTQVACIHHYHTYGVFEVQETVAMMVPCFQGQYPYLVRLHLYPSIGGIILDVDFDGKRVRRMTHTYINYPELSDDFDLEVSSRWQRPELP